MEIALQLLANGLIAGAIYALIASGFSLIYATGKFVHFAHGATVTVAAYTQYYLFKTMGLGFGFAAALTVVVAVAFGYAVDRIIYRKLREKKSSRAILMIASFTLLILFEALISTLFGPGIKSFGFIEVSRGMNILGASITPLQIIIIAVAVALFFTLSILMKKSRVGKAMRAVSNNKDVAEILGISSKRAYSWSVMLGSAVAGVAAILIGLEQGVEPVMGTNLMIKGFAASVIGGIGSVPGAIIGAFLLGISENVGIWFLPSGYKDAIVFVILFAFLLFRPQGILAKKRN